MPGSWRDAHSCTGLGMPVIVSGRPRGSSHALGADRLTTAATGGSARMAASSTPYPPLDAPTNDTVRAAWDRDHATAASTSSDTWRPVNPAAALDDVPEESKANAR